MRRKLVVEINCSDLNCRYCRLICYDYKFKNYHCHAFSGIINDNRDRLQECIDETKKYIYEEDR